MLKKHPHFMVGVRGFEPPASWSRTKHSTKLSHTPKRVLYKRDNYYNTHEPICQHILKSKNQIKVRKRETLYMKNLYFLYFGSPVHDFPSHSKNISL